MAQRGFTLVELVVVLGIIGTLLALATLQFGSMQAKSAIEAQVRTIYSKLTEVRSEALYLKEPRTVVLSGGKLKVYANATGSWTPTSQLPLSFPVVMATGVDRVTFSAGGMMLTSDGSDRAFCVQPGGSAANQGSIDSVVVTPVKTYMGKRASGGACVSDSITQK